MSLSSKNDKMFDSISAGMKPAAAVPGTKRSLSAPGTAVGMMVGNANESLRTRLADAEAKVDELARDKAEAEARADAKTKEIEGADLALKLDPARVRRSRFADRHPNAFVDAAFKDLCDLIRGTGGNTEAAKVRPIEGDPNFDYELASGHRRHAACLELGLPFKAEVHAYSDQELLKQMRSENSGRKELSGFELGRHYSGLIAEKTFVSGRDLAGKLGVSQSIVQRLLKFADLPDAIIAAFPDPREIRVEWVDRLVEAWQADRPRVEAEISGIVGQAGLRPATIYRRLAGVLSRNKVITREGSVLGRIRLVHGCPAVVLYKDAPDALLQRIQDLVVNWREEEGSGT